MPKRHSNHAGNQESLFLRLEELVLANSGEDAFEEVFKLLVAKLWDERSGQPSRFRPHQREAETYQAVVALLREAEKQWPGILDPAPSPALTAEHLHVCVAALAKHTLSDAGLTVMDGFFEFLTSKDAKGAKGQYFTPRHVVEFCVRMLRPGAAETVLDPACGSGGFLIHALNHVRREEDLTGAALQNYCSTGLWGFDIDARATRVAKALMILAGDSGANIFQLNSLLKPSPGGLSLFEAPGTAESGTSLSVEDVCRTRMRRHKGFDVILTNPPFAGDVREPLVLESYSLSRGRRRVERDVLFLERCVQLLRPGGRLAIVLPHNKFAVSAWGYVREWLLRKVRVLAVVGLGRHTFLPHTHQKAAVLFARKYGDKETPVKDPNLFFAISERDGKNSKGQFLTRPGAGDLDSPWESVDHDLADVVGGFHKFCEQESVVLGA